MIFQRSCSSCSGSWPTRYCLRPLIAISADSPPPPISPRPINPSSVSTSTTVRTKRPQCAPFEWRSGASSGTVTVVARRSVIFISFLVLGRSAGEREEEAAVDDQGCAGDERGPVRGEESDRLGDFA